MKFGDNSSSTISFNLLELIVLHDIIKFHRFFWMSIILRIWTIHLYFEFLNFNYKLKKYIMPNQISMNIASFCFRYYSFFKPSYRFPSFEFDHDLISIDVFIKIQENMPMNCITSKIERFVNLNEAVAHICTWLKSKRKVKLNKIK